MLPNQINPNPRHTVDGGETRQPYCASSSKSRIMSSTAGLLAEAATLDVKNSKRREAIYKQILEASKSAVNPDELRDQETALVKLGELYRDEK